MLKNLKLGMKMGIGFGVVILLTVAIGGLAIFNMLQIETRSVSLQDEYLPEVQITTDIERYSLLTMYNMRGFAMSFDESYYSEGNEYLAQVSEALTKAETLARTYENLVQLRANVDGAVKNVNEYERLSVKTEASIQQVGQLRDVSDTAAARFMLNCNEFLESQNAAMNREIQAGAPEAQLRERQLKIDLVNKIINAGNQLRIANFKGQLFKEYASMRKAVSDFAVVTEMAEELGEITRQEANTRQLNAIVDSGNAYVRSMESIINQFNTLEELNSEREMVANAVLESAQSTAMAGIEQTEQIAGDAVSRIGVSVKAIVTGLAIAILLAVLIAFALTMSIVKSLQKGVHFAQEIALGDLQAELAVNQKDELGILAEALREMQRSLQYKAKKIEQIAQKDLSVDIQKTSQKDELGESLIVMKNSLNELLGQVNSSVEQVNSGADQVSQASQNLSQGATEQASSLEEITSSTNQINSQSKQNAENATEAHSIARQATEDAEAGNKQMQNLSLIMERINVSSDEINKVVKVIDDIAFQINLLALNANVEAARAGKYGKGFAVVADEVRNLAVKSADSVKETTRMVEETVKNIKQGTEATDATAKQLASIVDGSGKVADFLEEIAQASREQAQAIEQITEGLDQIDEATQANTASAEESASASEELAGQAQQLRGMVAQFKLDERFSGGPRMIVDKSRAPRPITGGKASRHTQKGSYDGGNEANDNSWASQPLETGIKPLLPEEQIRLEDDDFDRF